MAIEITMPQMDQTMTTGKVGGWLVKEGDTVEQGDRILEIETDKVVHELEAPAAGKIAQILVADGSQAPVNAVLALLAAPGEQIEKRQTTATVEPGQAKAAAGGRAVKKASPAAQRLAQAKRVDLSRIKGSGPGGRIVEADVRAAYVAGAPTAPAASGRRFASPLARKLAKEYGLDYTEITGSGPGGRVVRDDVLAAAEAARVVPTGPTLTAQPEPLAAAQVLPITGIRQIISERMSISSHTMASVTLNTEVDVTELVALRAQLNDKLAGKGVKLTYTDLLVKVAAHALRDHPRLNATLADDGIHLLNQINIGVAVALADGLVVPVIKGVDAKGLSMISGEIKDMAERARDNRLSPGELRGGTFTVTNLGVYGIDTFTPIINPPECAILGMGRIVKKPAVHEDALAIRPMMCLSLSFDHRIVDGAPAAQFLQTLTTYIGAPYLLLV